MHYNLGVLLTKDDDYVTAADEFKRAIELVPGDSASHFNLGKLYADHLDDKELAVKYFQKYLKLEPQAEDSNWVKRFIASTQAWLGDEKLV